MQDYFGLLKLSKEQRREIVEANLERIAAIAANPYARKAYATHQFGKTAFIQIVMDADNLKRIELRLP